MSDEQKADDFKLDICWEFDCCWDNNSSCKGEFWKPSCQFYYEHINLNTDIEVE